MDYLQPIDHQQPDFGSWYDELPLWSAPFGMLTLKHVPFRNGLTYLDVGTGTGFLAVEVAQRAGKHSRVIAVDPWQAATLRLRGKIEALGLKNIQVLERDVLHHGLPDESVDVVLSNLGVNNFDDPQRVLDTLYRTTKTNGWLYLSTNLEGHMAEFYRVFEDTLRSMRMDDALLRLAEHIKRRGTVTSLRQWISDTGFTVLNVHCEDFVMRFADGTAFFHHFFIRLGFLPSWLAIIPEHAREKTLRKLEENLNAYARQQGDLSLTIPIACFEAQKPP